MLQRTALLSILTGTLILFNCSKLHASQSDSDANHTDTLPKTALQTPSTAKTKETSPIFMWKCVRGAQTIYLLGTIHIARANFYPLPIPIEAALNQSQILFVEADVLQGSREKFVDLLKKHGLCKPPQTLTSDLAPDTREALKQYFDWSGESLALYEPYRPWVVSQVLLSSALSKAGYKSELGIDRHLLEEAHSAGKKIVPLESVDSQLNMINSFDKSTQDKLLLGSIVELKNIKQEMEQIETQWKTGNAEAMEKLISHAGSSDQEIENSKGQLIDKRNLSMMDTLKQNLPKQGTVMVAVGAAHLVGANGLIKKLANEGFEVSQEQVEIKRNSATINFGGSNLKKMYYPEGLFRVSLPGEPEVKYETLNNIRSVDYAYNSFGGALTVSYMILPGAVSNQTKQQQLMQLIADAIVKKTKATSSTLVPVPDKAYSSMLLTCKLPATSSLTKQDIFLRSRMLISGRRIYVIGGQGMGDFFQSPLFKQFDSSLEIIPEQGYAYSATRAPASFVTSPGFSRSTSTAKSSQPDWEAIRKENQRKSEELHRKVKLDFERVRRELEDSRFGR